MNIERVYVVGDSYSYGFLKYFKLIKSPYIKTHTFFAEYVLNLSQHLDYIRRVNDGVNTNADIKKTTIENIIDTIKSYNPEIMIYNFGQVDISFSYFYNKVFGVPYNINTVINAYIDIIRQYSNNCKKVYIINFLPLFVDDTETLITEFVHLHIKDLHTRLTKIQIDDIFSIKKYRTHLYVSNQLLKDKINETKWNMEVIYIDYNKYIYKDDYMSYKKKFYIKNQNRHDNISITLDFHINASIYLETLIQNNIIPELNKIIFASS